MTYVVFTHDALPAPYDDWPEHEHLSDGTTLKAQPVQGVFAVERPDGSVKKCESGYGFLMNPKEGELDCLSLAEFQASYKGAEHVEVA